MFSSESFENENNMVEENVRMLETDMMQLLMSESMGGNAGSEKIDGRRYPCAAANGIADLDTGKILEFGNYISRNSVKEKNAAEFTLQVAFDPKTFSFFRIVRFFGGKYFSAEGKDALESAISQYNERHAADNKKTA